MEKCEIYNTKNGRFRWRTRDVGNNKITAYGGENFPNKRNAIRAYQGHSADTTHDVEIVDLTKQTNGWKPKTVKRRT